MKLKLTDFFYCLFTTLAKINLLQLISIILCSFGENFPSQKISAIIYALPHVKSYTDKLTDVSEMSLLLSIEFSYDLPLQVSGEALVQPKLLPCPVGYQVTSPTVGHLMSYNYLNQRMVNFGI